MRELIVFAIAFLWLFPSAVAFILLVLHRTHVVVEYANLFGLGKYFHGGEFAEWEQSNPDVGYFIFLDQRRSTFLTRLLRCPWCLVSWIVGLLNIPVQFALCPIVGFWWSILIGLMWAFSTGLFAVFLYFKGIILYKRALSS